MTQRNYLTFFSCLLSNHYLMIQKLNLQGFFVSSFKVAKTLVHVHCFHEKYFTCWDLRDMLETDKSAWKDSK